MQLFARRDFWAVTQATTRPVKMDTVNRIVAAQMERQHLPQMYSMIFVPQVEQQLVAQAVLAREAERLGLGANDTDVRRELQTGQLRPIHLSRTASSLARTSTSASCSQLSTHHVADFEGEVKSDIELQRLEAMVTGGLTVSDEAVRTEYKTQGTKVKFDYAVISASDLKKTINPSDADLQTFFTQNAPKYATAVPETRKIDFFAFDASNSLKNQPAVTDADVQAYYNQHQSQYKVDEQVQTRTSLMPVARGADAKTDAAAKAEGAGRVEPGEGRRQLCRSRTQVL